MNGKFKLSKVAALLAGCSLLIGCGDSGDNQDSRSAKNAYGYSSLPICIDADLNGTCGDFEEVVTNVTKASTTTTNAPYLIDDSGYLLTAPATAQVVSPFTTLIQNEVMFNPAVAGNPTLAQEYLQSIFGNKYQLDFNQLMSIHGPNEATEILLNSFRHALSLEGSSAYLKLAAAIDLMVSQQTFDITDLLTQAELDNNYVNLNHQYLVSGSYPLEALRLPRSITVNEHSGMLLALTADSNLLQVNTSTGAYSSFTPSSTTASAPPPININYPGYDHHGDHDHDKDHDKDHGSEIIQYQKPSVLVSAAQGKNNKDAYLLYQPTAFGDHTVSNSCNNSGDNGIYLTEIGKNSQSSPLSTTLKIDAFGGASGTTPPPIVIEEPSTPDSSASCKNNHITHFMPLLKHNRMAAVFTSGSRYSAEIQLLNNDTLASSGYRYQLNSTLPLLVPSKSESLLLVAENKGNTNVILDSSTLSPRSFINKNNIEIAAFTNDDQEIIISDGSQFLSWFSTSNPNQPNTTLDIKDKVLALASDPEGRFSAALTAKQLYFIDNKTKAIIKSAPYNHSSVYGMSMLNDKVIISRSGALDYIQFGNLVGAPIKVGYQLISKDLITRWAAASDSPLSATNLGYLLKTVGEEDKVSDEFSDIDVEWVPANASSFDQVTAVKISGYFRNERVNLFKHI